MIRLQHTSPGILRIARRCFASKRDYKGKENEEESLKRGLEYEHHCVRVLKEFSLYSMHKGYAGDKGIDIQGFWQVVPADQFDHLSVEPHMFNIIGEVKHERNLCRSVYIKELEGVVSRWKHKQHHGSFITSAYPKRMELATKRIPMIGLIINTSGYSQPALEAFEGSHNPLIIAVIRPSHWLPEEPTKENLKSCLVYWKPNNVAKEIMPGMNWKVVESEGTTVPSVRLYYNNLDVSQFELPKE